MDFCILAILVGVAMMWLTISYDIICQWSRNFRKRVPQFPVWMQPPTQLLDNITYVIPKFHIYGHGTKCQT
jgi:Kyakuja-Dileera-Zisupton transposase